MTDVDKKTDKLAIIGLVGHPSSGKDTVAAYLVDTHQFIHVATGDLLRFYIAEHELGEPTRPLLQQVGNILRSEHGADYLARLALKTEASHLVVSGLRTLAEVAAIREAGGSILSVTAPIKLRYQRALERGRVTDEITFEMFVEQEEAEAANLNPNAQNVAGVVAMADYVVNNESDLAHLHRQVNVALKRMLAAEEAGA